MKPQDETPEIAAPVVCSACDWEICHVCGACPCDEERLWVCVNRYEHWRIPPLNE